MKKITIIAITTLFMALIIGSSAYGEVINFDDINGPNYSQINDGYGSTATIYVEYDMINPNNMSVYADYLSYYDQWGNNSNNLDGVAWARWNTFALITFTPIAGYEVTLNSFILGAYNWWDVDDITIQVGYDGNIIDYSSTVSGAQSGGYDSFSPNISSEGPITILFGANSGIGIDEIAFHNSPIQADPVPEPSTVLLLGAGIIGMVAVLRRRNKR